MENYLNNFDKLYISEKDRGTYELIIQRKHLSVKNLNKLYMLNLLISKELYTLINIIETLFRYKLLEQMTEVYKTPNWFNKIKWSETEQTALRNAARKLTKQLIYWMDKDYFYIAVQTTKFIKYYRLLVTSAYNKKAFAYFFIRKIKRFLNTYRWKIMRMFPDFFCLTEEERHPK